MAEIGTQLRPIRFGNFEADLRSGELRKDGVKLKFGGQPFQVLAFLLDHAGEVVTREELQKHLWPDTFVDVDHNLNTAINKIREALGDSAEDPRFVETLPKRGYRFIMPVTGHFPSTGHTCRRRAPGRYSRNQAASYLITYKICPSLASSSGHGRRLRLLEDCNAATSRSKSPSVSPSSPMTVTENWDRCLPMVPESISANECRAQAASSIRCPCSGGEATPLPVVLKQPSLLDISRDGTELLVKSGEADRGDPIWIQPVAGGSPRRVGTSPRRVRRDVWPGWRQHHLRRTK